MIIQPLTVCSKSSRTAGRQGKLAVALGLALCCVAPLSLAETAFESSRESDKALLEAAGKKNGVVDQALASTAKSVGEGNPSLSFNTDKGNLNLSQSALDLNRQSDDAAVSLGFGFGPNPGVTAAGSVLLHPNMAIGGRLHTESKLTDVVLNAVGDLGSSGLRLQGAVNYMTGKQDFDFYRSRETARLSQFGYYGSASWFNPGASDLGLQSMGVALWGAKAKNHSQFDTLSYVDETSDAWVLTRDHRLISAGSLAGGALELQYAPAENLVLKGAFGMERMSFPFSDGSQETTRKPYLDLKLTFAADEKNQFAFGAKTGAAERRIDVEWQRPTFSLVAFNANGVEKTSGRWGVGVNFDILALLGNKKSSGGVSLASSLRPRPQQNSSELLKTAMTRPTQLPSTFLAKVDPTGLERTIVEKSSLPPGGVVDAQGNLRIPVGEGQGQVFDSQRNQASFTDSVYKMEGNVLVVNVSALPHPQSLDQYSLHVRDGNQAVWLVTFDTVKQ
ncbi:hypothetical protein DB032_19525 [Chromobacterium sp. Panama]|uniref:hypothetical protein n=1 Tax=Chromobacterium sp. Panama TaxID=2161826 RepID=UPI000D303818|nr:hypothetical protein [Chromobacterium sp. Panama]PTU66957.1 hypothetical protein DB032_19525 [Chromobacterium sp. Panama]